MQTAYPGMSEYYILWHDWHWVYKRLELIGKDKREQRRWDLMSRLASAAGGNHGGEAMEYWQELVESTLTAAEKAEQAALEEEKILQELAEQRKERQAMMRATKSRISTM